ASGGVGLSAIEPHLSKRSMRARKLWFELGYFLQICFSVLLATEREQRRRSLIISLKERRVRRDRGSVEFHRAIEVTVLLSSLPFVESLCRGSLMVRRDRA